jgi:NMD protein affecting ribosome stability and mRNA decay
MRRRVPAPTVSAKHTAGLEVCVHCGRDFVQPLDWEPLGEERWWMFLRCAECGVSREVTVANAEAERFETALHSRAALVSAAVRGLEAERMEDEVRVFVQALQRDLIDAADFAR